MAITIKHAILHVLNNGTGSSSYFSKQELDIDSETCYGFISKHVRRLMGNSGAREATFKAESPVYALVQEYQKGRIYFKDLSVKLCEQLLQIMQKNSDIPAADVLVTAFESGQDQYIAIIKLNYAECFTHRILPSDGEYENSVIKNNAVLPVAGSKVEEACLIPFEPMILRIFEKSFQIDGEETSYLSELFLQCETQISKKETAQIINEIAAEICAKHFDDDIEVMAKVKIALIEEAEESEAAEEESFRLENVARRVFPENEQVKTEFIALAEDLGLPLEVKLDTSFVKQQFKTQTFKADNGIEIKCPSELFKDPDTIQITTNTDGSMSITLKNLRRIPAEI